jgi:enoyl-CoA hydratase/carnithine racemase
MGRLGRRRGTRPYQVAVGLHPLLGGTQRLVQRAGVARAKEISMMGRRHTPEAFERWGITNLVVPEEELAVHIGDTLFVIDRAR